MDAFDPIAFTFTKLDGFKFPGGVAVYELACHPAIDGNPDFLRLNAYLSKDGDFVTVWWGLLEPLFAEPALANVILPEGFDVAGSYREELFRGYIETMEAARHIVPALRLASLKPQRLRAGPDGKLSCDLLG